MANIKKRGIIKNALGTVIDYTKAKIGDIKTKSNVSAIASRYGIVEGIYGAKNYDKVINTANTFADKGDMLGMRNFLKSQRDKAKKQGQKNY